MNEALKTQCEHTHSSRDDMEGNNEETKIKHLEQHNIEKFIPLSDQQKHSA